MKEKRKFTRIVFSRPATLSDGVHQWQCKLIDLSLKGALIERPDNWQFNDEADYRINFCLGETDVELSMQVELAHEQSNVLGVICSQIDIESASHLKRLVELNMGDDDLLNRELAELSHPTPL